MNTKRVMKTEFLMLTVVLLRNDIPGLNVSLGEETGSNKNSKYVTVKAPARVHTVHMLQMNKGKKQTNTQAAITDFIICR